MSKVLAWKAGAPADVRRSQAVESAGREVREATTGRVVPRVWAVADGAAEAVERSSQGAYEAPKPELAFYRKYTEAMLRRYLRLSMETGRVPSLLGREMFRGQVTRYRVSSFEDVVIFCYDVERCLRELDSDERQLIKRVTLQEYTLMEAAPMLGLSLRSCVRRYGAAVDHLTEVLLRVRMLEPLKACQGGREA